MTGEFMQQRSRVDPTVSSHLPMSREEMSARGWDQADVVFVTGDAYVDHPSFAMGILGRVLEAAGFRVAILSQPDWRSVDAFRSLGAPRLFWAVSAGNMDSMLNHYTANRRIRSDDAYSPGGRAGLRPDRATNVYAQRCREAFKGIPVIAGGVEASLRRVAHYDYWSDTVRPSSLVSSKADLVVFGMGEALIVSIAQRLDAGEPVNALRDQRGVAYLLGAKEELPEFPGSMRTPATPADDTLELPTFEAVTEDKVAFSRATHLVHRESNPFNARRLVQLHGTRWVVQNPPALPISTDEMDAIYDLPYARTPHPSYQERVPAFEMMRTSVTMMRGCFGGCTFCSITTHQGRIIQSRSPESVLREVKALGADPETKGIVSDIGGPTANMFHMRCTRPEVEAICRRPSCVHPTICKLLGTDHSPLKEVMRESRKQPGIRKVHVASGVRMDLAQRDPEYLEELAAHHVGGHLKVAPEHVSPRVLDLMKKPRIDDFTGFSEAFEDASRRVGKEQYLVPYFIASHPGSDIEDMIELALYLKQAGYKPRQVQDFIPAPMDVATAMYYTGLDPATLRPVPVARNLKDRKLQRALMQFFLPENWFLVRDALLKVGRRDLIGNGPRCLIPDQPPRTAQQARRRQAQQDLSQPPGRQSGEDWDAFTGRRDGKPGDRGDSPPERSPERRSVGYRPGRKGFVSKKGSPPRRPR